MKLSASLNMRVEVPQDEAMPRLTTYLFRRDAQLSETMYLTLQRIDDPTSLNFASFGCSDGSEIDSWLAHLNQACDNRGTTATGYDNNNEVLQRARQGKHVLATPWRTDSDWPLRFNEEVGLLSKWGFNVSKPSNGEAAYGTEVDAGPVRDGHTVSFQEQDITKPISGEPVDVAIVNNVLPHLDYQEVTQIIQNVASVLKENGILNLGLGGFANMSAPEIQSVERLLRKNFNLKPLLTTYGGDPVIFGRS